MLSPEFYVSGEIFEREQRNIFGRLWLYAGLRQLLAAPDAFLTRTLGGVPVVIQNFSGKLRAFENQCLHRQMPLQFEPYGKRRLACRYHGWVYDAQGAPETIPSHDELYGFSDAQRAALRLREFALAEVGNLLFVNLSAQPLPIEEQFTPEFMSRLAAISSHFDDEAIYAPIAARYNWKLNFENVLDYNHVRYLHPRTFQPLVVAQPPAAAVPAHGGGFGAARLADLSYETRMPFKIAPRAWHPKVARFGAEETYYNFFIYPNVNFISLGGLVFLVQQFTPLAPDRTEIGFTLTTARNTQRVPALPAILWGHFQGEKVVLDEDIRVLERLQAGLHGAGRRAFHGAYEHQIMKTAAVYSRLMSDAAA